MTHLVGSVSWNEHRWRGRPDEGDGDVTGHGNVRAGYVGNEHLNLAMTPETTVAGWKYAAVEKFHTKARFSDGGLIFLWSRSPKSRKSQIFGVLAKVERLEKPVDCDTEIGRLQMNLRLPAVAGLALLFEGPLDVKEAYLRDNGVTKKGPGQACGCYIDDASACAILTDAARAGSTGAAGLLRMYGWELDDMTGGRGSGAP